MSSINDGINFIYANRCSDEYEVQLYTSIDSTTRSSSGERRTLVTSKNAYKNTTDLHGVKYDEPLVFDLIIGNSDGTFIDAYKERELKKWLLKNNRNWLQIDQDDIASISYHCIATEAQLIDVGAYTGALLVTFQCDSPNAYSSLYKKSYTTSSGTLTFNLNNNTDYDDYILCPKVIIKPSSNGNISIKNNTTNKTITINNCVTTETITLDSKNDIIESSNSRILIDKWNKNFLELISGINNITLTGNFLLQLEYRLPIRIGG